jgi:hypothetical protein
MLSTIPGPSKTKFFLYFKSRRAVRKKSRCQILAARKRFATSLWENKGNADAYAANTDPQERKTLRTMIDGTPKIQTFASLRSTVHDVRTAV